MFHDQIEHNEFKLDSVEKQKVAFENIAKKPSRQKTIKYKRSQSFDKNKKDSEKMSDAGYFILLFSANIFLTQDFEYCAQITLKNFSFIENTSLFEGNMLRFRALAH